MARSPKTWRGYILLSLLMWGCACLRASQPLGWGLQLGMAFPASSDLKVTTGPGLNPVLGGYGEWGFRESQALRGRVEFAFFGQGTQVSDAPGLHQELTTTVKQASLGVEYLFRPEWQGRRWSVGAGLYTIRWSVDSTHRLVTPSGTFTPSGATTWVRQGQGVLAGYRLNQRADFEFRIVSSHYGQENQPTRVASLNLLLHF